MTEFNFDTVFDETMQTHNLDTVVILGHLNPDGDAAGSVMSLAHYIHVNYPQYRVFPYLAKTLERGPKKMAWKIRHLFLLRCRTYPENNIVP